MKPTPSAQLTRMPRVTCARSFIRRKTPASQAHQEPLPVRMGRREVVAVCPLGSPLLGDIQGHWPELPPRAVRYHGKHARPSGPLHPCRQPEYARRTFIPRRPMDDDRDRLLLCGLADVAPVHESRRREHHWHHLADSDRRTLHLLCHDRRSPPLARPCKCEQRPI